MRRNPSSPATKRPLKKKGQIIGQIFVYLMGIVIIGMIVLYGYKVILNFQGKTEDVALVTFKTTLQRSLREMAIEYGSVKMQMLTLPSDFNRVCFTDINKEAGGSFRYDTAHRKAQGLCTPTTNDDYNPIACNYWSDEDVVDNVFLIGPERVEPIFIGDDTDKDFIRGYFTIDTPGYLCVKAKSGQIKLRMEGIGKGVLLSTGWI
ncbi:MAG: hypothetical protein GXP63_03205 [DPANN group archaeon]|nr:hypothetical protein [DPANN group archaeon]